MMNVENIEVYGWSAAIRGMRNPMNSWDKSDSAENCLEMDCRKCLYNIPGSFNCKNEIGRLSGYFIGPNDLDLMKRLYKAGTEHRKFLRMIVVTMDITAPLYWWKEFDTYKVGTVANSCSTMHKIHDKEFTLNDFSHEHLLGRDAEYEDTFDLINSDGGDFTCCPTEFIKMICGVLNFYRKKFIETRDKKYWWQIIQLLPSSYNQRRTIQMSYENVVAMIKQREYHKLDEWREFVKVLQGLPYVEGITCD